MPQNPQRLKVYGGHHKGSPKVFLVIYLTVALAIGTAVLLLKPEAKSIDEIMAAEKAAREAAAEKAASQKAKTAPKPPKATPKEKPVELANAEKNKAEKPADPAPEEPKPKTEPDPEPSVPTLTEEEEKQIEGLYPFPETQALMEIVNNWLDVPQNAFPKLVAIRTPVDFELTQGGKIVARGKMPTGSMMVPMHLNGDQLVLSGGGANPITVTVPVEETDFKELIQTRYDTYVEMRNAQVLSQRQAERDRRLGAVALEQSLSDWNDGSDPRFDPIKASLLKGDASIYSLADAAKWRWGGTETLDGTEFQTAFVLIVSEAAFGVTERELKVLMQDGKVVYWLDSASGELL